MIGLHHVPVPHAVSLRATYMHDVFLPAFDRVQDTVSFDQQDYVIAGKRIRLMFYTPQLAVRFSWALAHHRTDLEITPDITIYLFDSVCTGVSFSAPWENRDYIWTHRDTSVPVDDQSCAGVYWHDKTIQMYDREHQRAFFWTHRAEDLPNWLEAASLRGVFHWFFSDCGMQLIHGAVVGKNNRSVVLSAKSGSGKSTTALACLLAGMEYVSDDYTIMERVEGSWIAHNLYNSIKVLPDGFTRFPELQKTSFSHKGVFDARVDSKGILSLHNDAVYNMIQSSVVSAFFIPQIIGGETHIMPTSHMEAMRAIIPSTLFQLPLAGPPTITRLKEMIADISCFSLQLGENIREIPNVIEQFLCEQP